MVTEAAHRLNYERSVKKKTMTAVELHSELGKIIAAGQGQRPVFIMECCGLTHAIPIAMCFASEAYDGEVVWIISPEETL